jgi:hypothetical protein
MTALPPFRLSSRVLADVVWRDLLADLDLEREALNARLRALWDACDATRAKMAYDTGSISASSGVALYALARRLAPQAMFEVGTFIGRSTVALALGAEAAGVAAPALYTCDVSNDFHVPYGGATRITGFARKTSTQALGEVAAAGARIDLFHFDGRLAPDDIELLKKVASPQAAYALDDFEGAEKGVANSMLLRAQPWLQQHVLAFPPDRALLADFGLRSPCTTALLVPAAFFGFTSQ